MQLHRKMHSDIVWKECIILGFIFLSIITQCQSAPPPLQVRDDEVVFFEDAQYDGDRLFVTLGKGCYTMDRDWDDKVSSVDTHGNCIMAFEKSDCRGQSVKLSQGNSALADLGRLNFDNVLSSISVCSSKGSAGSSERSRKSDKNGLEIWRVGLEEHNKYRRMHGVPSLSGDRHMHDEAQDHADYLAKNNRFEVSPGTKYGENLATSYKKDKLDAIRDVVKRWYDKIEYFNFRDPEVNKDRPKTAQFSSIVWKSTTHMGIGVAKNEKDDKWVVVVFYDPAATRKNYKENVPPVAKQIHAEAPVLFRTSALSNFYNRRRYDDFA